MNAREIGLSSNSLYNSYEYFFGKRKTMTQELVDLESERVGALGVLLSMIDMMLLFETLDHFASSHAASKQTWKTLREARDRYDEISKRYLDARLNERKPRE